LLFCAFLDTFKGLVRGVTDFFSSFEKKIRVV